MYISKKDKQQYNGQKTVHRKLKIGPTEQYGPH